MGGGSGGGGGGQTHFAEGVEDGRLLSGCCRRDGNGTHEVRHHSSTALEEEEEAVG